jgi:hypothetical protein
MVIRQQFAAFQYHLLRAYTVLMLVSTNIYNFICVIFLIYGCETWSLTVREEHKMRVFESRVLRRIFGPKRDGVTGGWRKLHKEELHNLYCSAK